MRRMYCFVRCAAVATVLIGCSLPLHAQLIGDIRSAGEEPLAEEEGGTSQETTLDSTPIEDWLAAASAAATSQVPEELRDPAFDRYVDLLLLGDAWERLDAALMTDVALQLAEGERVLFRPHKAIKSDELFKLAAKIAIDKRDQPTLDRLQKHFEQCGDKSACESLATARKLVGEARAVDPALLIPVDEITPEGYALYRGVLGEIKAARCIGNREALSELEGELEKWPGLSDKQKEYLKTILGQSRAEMQEGETPELARHLDKLSGASRGWDPRKTWRKIEQGDIHGAFGGVDFRIPTNQTHFSDARDYSYWVTAGIGNLSGVTVFMRFSGGTSPLKLDNGRQFPALRVKSEGRSARSPWVQLLQPTGKWGTPWSLTNGRTYRVVNRGGWEPLVIQFD